MQRVREGFIFLLFLIIAIGIHAQKVEINGVEKYLHVDVDSSQKIKKDIGIESIDLGISYIKENYPQFLSTNYLKDRLDSFSPSVSNNWVKKGGSCYSPPVSYDLDGDGDLEIFSCVDEIVIYHQDGLTFPSSPIKATAGSFVNGSLVIGDITGDGIVELVVCEAVRKDSKYCFFIVIYNKDGDILWRKEVLVSNNWVINSPSTLTDLTGDGVLDIVFPARLALSWGDKGILYAFYLSEGKLLDVYGYPKITKSTLCNSIATAQVDYDHDGQKDTILVASDMDGYVYVYGKDGVSLPNWPKKYITHSNGSPSPAIADLDQDGDFEIIVTGFSGYDGTPQTAGSGAVCAFNLDGSIVDGWPARTTAVGYGVPSNMIYASLGIGDINNDEVLEVIAISLYNEVCVWDAQGKRIAPPLFLIPDEGGCWDGGPTLVDINSDGKTEILVSAPDEEAARIFILDKDLNILAEGAFEDQGYLSYITASDLVVGDGMANLIFGTLASNLYVFSIKINEPVYAQWPMFQHDIFYTGWYRKLRVVDKL